MDEPTNRPNGDFASTGRSLFPQTFALVRQRDHGRFCTANWRKLARFGGAPRGLNVPVRYKPRLESCIGTHDGTAGIAESVEYDVTALDTRREHMIRVAGNGKNAAAADPVRSRSAPISTSGWRARASRSDAMMRHVRPRWAAGPGGCFRKAPWRRRRAAASPGTDGSARPSTEPSWLVCSRGCRLPATIFCARPNASSGLDFARPPP